MLISAITAAVQYRYTTETLAANAMAAMIAGAVRYYSRFNPRPRRESVTTVGNVAAYSLTYTVSHVLEVLWYPSGLSTDVDLTDQFPTHRRSLSYRDHPSLRVIDRINKAEEYRSLQGQWYFDKSNSKLTLVPVPAQSGSTIYVLYTSPHVINQGLTGYDTIPDEDFNIIVCLTLAEILEARAVTASAEPNYTEGQGSVAKQFVQQNGMANAAKLRQLVEAKYGGTVPSGFNA